MPNGIISLPGCFPSLAAAVRYDRGRNFYECWRRARSAAPANSRRDFSARSALPARAEQAHKAMVVSESALASEAGLAILKQGGNAIDAATATALAVGVTNPASCGIGGGGFMLIYIAKEGKFYALDYREAAPHCRERRHVLPRWNLTRNSRRSDRSQSPCRVRSRESTRAQALRNHEVSAGGRTAIKLARDGFPIGQHLAGRDQVGRGPCSRWDQASRKSSLRRTAARPPRAKKSTKRNSPIPSNTSAIVPSQSFTTDRSARNLSHFSTTTAAFLRKTI